MKSIIHVVINYEYFVLILIYSILLFPLIILLFNQTAGTLCIGTAENS
jgi:hypothetical protein